MTMRGRGAGGGGEGGWGAGGGGRGAGQGRGGGGRGPGAKGARRELRFLEPMTVTTLSSHRLVPPYGMAGGRSGALGRHWVEHPDGAVTTMKGSDSVPVDAGDVFVLETPGGGGYRSPELLDPTALRSA